MAHTFQSRATADLIMLDAVAKQLLELLEKTPGEAGIITLEQIPQALAVLDQAVLDDEAKRQALKEADAADDMQQKAQAYAMAKELGPISLRQRVVPFADMLRRSAQEGYPVTWHV